MACTYAQLLAQWFIGLKANEDGRSQQQQDETPERTRTGRSR